MVRQMRVIIGEWWRGRRGTWWWAILVIVVPVIGLTAAAAWIVPLWAHATSPRDHLEALRIALTIGAGTGGVVALVLAGRRQWSTEQAHKATEHDAAERRITELYTKAVDQLGSDQAAVRLGGLYALERLANTAPTQQGTIGNVICAYLRMPYTNPQTLNEDATEDDRKEHDRLVQELETRTTALEILIRHSRYSSKRSWRVLRIRLQRANLVNADLTHAQLVGADLTHADLTGADLTRARLSGANLTGARLNRADLTEAVLALANLTEADLTEARLEQAKLNQAKLTHANLTHAYLRRTDLTDAHLAHADLTDAHLPHANLTRANLADANLTDAYLADAILTEAHLTDDQRQALRDVPGPSRPSGKSRSRTRPPSQMRPRMRPWRNGS